MPGSFFHLMMSLPWDRISKHSVVLWSKLLIFETASDYFFTFNCFLKPSQVIFSQFSVILSQLFVIFRILTYSRKINNNKLNKQSK